MKWFDENKRYGFLEYGQQQRAFVHISDFADEGATAPKPGHKVEFDLTNHRGEIRGLYPSGDGAHE